MSASASEQAQPTNTNTAPDPMAAALRQAAQGVDNGIEVKDDAILKASGTEGDGKPAGGDAGKKTATEGSERKTGTDPEKKPGEGDNKEGKKTDPKPGEQKPGDQQKETEFEKARKDADRLDKSWKGYQAALDKLKQDQAALEQRQRDLQQREQQVQQGSNQQRREPLKDRLGYTAEQYEDAIVKWEKEGRFDLVDMAKDNLKALREQERVHPQQGEQTQRQPATVPEHTRGTPEFNTKWNANLQELENTEEYKDLKNRDSDLFKDTAKLLQQEPRLAQFNDGIKIAAEIAKLRRDAGSVPALRKQLEEQTQELEKLRKATTPGAGDGESRGGPAKPFEQLSSDEQKAQLKRAAAEADNG